MPPDLAAFRTVAEAEAVRREAGALGELELAVAREPAAAAPVDALRAQHAKLTRALRDAIEKRVDVEGIVEECDRVVDAGNKDFIGVYSTVNNVMESAEADGKQHAAGAVATLRDTTHGDGVAAQRKEAAEAATLLSDAAAAKPAFDALVGALAEVAPGVDVQLERYGEVGKDGAPRSGLKKTARIAEKAALRPDAEGSCTLYVCDVVRAMFVAPSMDAVGSLVDGLVALVRAGTIVVVRIKDRCAVRLEGTCHVRPPMRLPLRLE